MPDALPSTLPGWILLWLIGASLILLALTILVWAVAHSLSELKQDLTMARSFDRQHDLADLWRREPRHGMASQFDIRRRPLTTEQTHPMTLEERAHLIDERARDSYSHGTYCEQVPRVALQHLQEAVAEERDRCAKVATAMADRLVRVETDPTAAEKATVALHVANVIRDGTGGI